MQPNSYNLHLALFPFFGYIIDLLVLLEAKKRHPEDTPASFQPAELQQIRRQILNEQDSSGGGYVYFPCRAILSRAIAQGVIEGGETNPEYQSALREIDLTETRAR